MTTPPKWEHVLDVPVHFEAVLPGPVMHVGELLALAEGSLIKTARPAGETVEVFAGGSLIGSAELAGDNGLFAVRMVSFHGSR
jgi:flagellar motor switch/type III secretory pathway protein FliN